MGHPREHIKSGKRAWRASPLQDQKIRAEKYAQPRVAVPPRRAKIRGAKYAQKKRWRPEGRRYDKKDGGHDIPAAARNLRYRAPTKQEDGDVKSPLQMRAAWIGASRPHPFPVSDIPSGRSSARMRIDPSTSVSPAIYFRRTSCSMARRFVRNTSSLSLPSPWK